MLLRIQIQALAEGQIHDTEMVKRIAELLSDASGMHPEDITLDTLIEALMIDDNEIEEFIVDMSDQLRIYLPLPDIKKRMFAPTHDGGALQVRNIASFVHAYKQNRGNPETHTKRIVQHRG